MIFKRVDEEPSTGRIEIVLCAYRAGMEQMNEKKKTRNETLFLPFEIYKITEIANQKGSTNRVIEVKLIKVNKIR
jgi:hypothetical protein